jgi:hypothetical protein
LGEYDTHECIERMPAFLDPGAQDCALKGIEKENRQTTCMGVR